jgi:AcrR family transcriptional regulator
MPFSPGAGGVRLGLMPSGVPAGQQRQDGWRQRSVERSLRTAREKAESRSDRFIRAASELLFETGNLDFTVQELVERSKMSLRSFYQHFGSKDELLLAVFEGSIATYVDSLRSSIEQIDDPLERLRAYVDSFYQAGRGPNQAASQALSRYLLLLTQTHPSELARVLEPQVALLSEILEAGVASGQLRRDVAPASLTLLITHTLMATVEMNVLRTHLTGEEIGPEDLWAFCAGGVVRARR